jgi:hypothetical protein
MTKQMKLFKLMKKGAWRTSLEIEQHVRTVAVASMIADLRKKGCVLEREYVGLSKTKSQIHKYRLISFPDSILIDFKNQIERGWINELRTNN